MNIVRKLIKKRLTLGAVESFTGGGFSNHITNIPHASYVFYGSIVSYDPEIKENVVGVSKETIERYGTVSKECAEEMARGGQKLLGSDITISFTGNAGPSASEGKEVGLVYIGMLTKENLDVFELHLKGTRLQIKKQAIAYAVKKIENYLGI
jgi:PncC family amidohydrolase